MFVSMVIDLQVQENFNWTCGDRKSSEESGALTSRKAKANGPGAARLRSLVSLPLLNLSRGGWYKMGTQANRGCLIDSTDTCRAQNEHQMCNRFAVIHSHPPSRH